MNHIRFYEKKNIHDESGALKEQYNLKVKLLRYVNNIG